MKEIIQIGLFEVKMDPEKRSDESAQCPSCVDGVCQCANDEQGFRHLERRSGKICEDENCNCEPEDELEDQEEE
tara:strand:+ start:1433 stop:1654 length:222 start_codon:yes stop_codon:yes gene_type:complete